MAQDLGNYGNKLLRERVSFRNFCLVTFGQNSGNNGFSISDMLFRIRFFFRAQIKVKVTQQKDKPVKFVKNR